MKKFIILFIIGFALFATSCTLGKFLHKTAPATSFTPQVVRLDLTMDQFEYLGETEISVTSKTYFGVFRRIESINGLPKEMRNKKIAVFYGNKDIPVNGIIKRAAYKVIEDFPNADYYVPVSYQKDVNRMFLGNTKTLKMKIKAYKFKN